MSMFSEELRELDRLYNEGDQLFSRFAHDCGISGCAYWMLYDIVSAGSDVALSTLVQEWSYSKQTINSALKTLKARGYVDLHFIEGSRKNKAVSLTPEGAAFAERYVAPAMRAEQRAIDGLAPEDRKAFIRLMRSYNENLARELSRALEECNLVQKG